MPELIASKDAYKRGLFTDCTLKCQGEVFKCHKIILCAYSKVFTAALTGSFKEAIDNTIELHDESPDEISAFLDILYGGITENHREVAVPYDSCRDVVKLPLECAKHGEEDFKDLIDTLDAFVSMYALADRLSAPEVKQHFVSRFDYQLSQHRCASAVNAILSSKIVHRIYSTTPELDRGLRGPISDYLEWELLPTLRSSHFAEVSYQVDGLAMDMLVLAGRRRGLEDQYQY